LERFKKCFEKKESVKEFYKEKEMLTIKSELEESVESRMARFLNGLNHDIQDVVARFFAKQ